MLEFLKNILLLYFIVNINKWKKIYILCCGKINVSFDRVFMFFVYILFYLFKLLLSNIYRL